MDMFKAIEKDKATSGVSRSTWKMTCSFCDKAISSSGHVTACAVPLPLFIV